jgi:hypothetical protein
MGADFVINNRREDAVARIKELTGGEGATFFVETSGAGSALRDCILAAKRYARISILSFYEKSYDHEATVPMVKALEASSGVHEYTLWMILLCLAAEKARPFYKTEQLYWDTFSDLCYKAQECQDVYGIWGTFVAHWYPIFYNGSIVKLGRMEYQLRKCPYKTPQTAMGITVNPGDPILALHIPASGEPFDEATRLDSYQQAWKYFCPDGSPLVCVCGSWLLYDKYDEVFAPGTNIATFRKEFYMLNSKQSETFGNIWRVFGSAYTQPTQLLPENTSLQRAFKRYMLAGGTHGSGNGVIVFDGEKLLSATK